MGSEQENQKAMEELSERALNIELKGLLGRIEKNGMSSIGSVILTYAVQQGLFSQGEINRAQGKYESSQSKRLYLKSLE